MPGGRRLESTLLIFIVITAAACNTAAAPSSGAAARSVPSAAPSKAAWPAGAPDAWLLVGSDGGPYVRVIQASTGQRFLEMPMGAAAGSDWARAIVASPNGATTTIQDLVVQPGQGGPQISIDGAWRLPTIGYDPTPVGVSTDGSTAVLVDAAPAASKTATSTSRFAVLSVVPLAGPPQIVELPGAWSYDAISSNGRVLYVVQHLDGDTGQYQVRAIDLPSATMRPGVIADKRNLDEAMAGWPIAQLRAPTGMVYTIYRGVDHPFIHALNTTDGWAVCIDLPATARNDQEAAAQWGLAASTDWTTVYAANAALGRVSEVKTADFSVRRTVAIDSVAAGPTIELAKFGHQESGPVARKLVLAPDGETAFAAGPDGILAIGTKDLKVRARWLGGSAVDALGLTPDGRTLFALLADGGRIVAVDARSGKVFGQVPGSGYDRLLAVVPW